MNTIEITNEDYTNLNTTSGYDWITAFMGNNPTWTLDKLFKTPKWQQGEFRYKVYIVQLEDKIYRAIVDDKNKEVYREIPHYTGRGGYHGGGRPKKEENEKTIYKTISIAGNPEEIEEIKEMAKAENKTISRFIIEKILK